MGPGKSTAGEDISPCNLAQTFQTMGRVLQCMSVPQKGLGKSVFAYQESRWLSPACLFPSEDEGGVEEVTSCCDAREETKPSPGSP